MCEFSYDFWLSTGGLRAKVKPKLLARIFVSLSPWVGRQGLPRPVRLWMYTCAVHDSSGEVTFAHLGFRSRRRIFLWRVIPVMNEF